ncbi:MAG TPA: DsbA family protein [Steroidobacteraceae bacterium]|nr:DsbA family protein [Steroidobacteraceae bacterium]
MGEIARAPVAPRRLHGWPLLLLAIGALIVFATDAHAQQLERISAAGERAILRPPGLQMTGARHPRVTIVEYFDYNCPFCRRMVPTLAKVLAEDRTVAVVYKDWPVLGKASVFAAVCALAAAYQGKYLAAHAALLDGPRLTGDAQIELLLQRAGIDVVRLRADLRAHAADIAALLERNDAEARALELRGTPGILVGRTLVPGVVGADDLQRLVAESRGKAR